jgi:hypothetical protein
MLLPIDTLEPSEVLPSPQAATNSPPMAANRRASQPLATGRLKRLPPVEPFSGTARTTRGNGALFGHPPVPPATAVRPPAVLRR